MPSSDSKRVQELDTGHLPATEQLTESSFPIPNSIEFADPETSRSKDEGNLGQPLPNFGRSAHLAWVCERLIERGNDSLGDTLADYELLEMLLFLANPRADTKSLAKAAIKRFGSFAGVLTAATRDLFDVPGFNWRSVASLRLVLASAARLARADIMDRPVFKNWDRVLAYLHTIMARSKVEQFRILFLDTRNRLLADEAHGRGTVNHTPVYAREVVKRALELHATALILVHNHPSGDPSPSADDIAVTKEIKTAAGALGITLHDHIVIGNGRWASFRKERLL